MRAFYPALAVFAVLVGATAAACGGGESGTGSTPTIAVTTTPAPSTPAAPATPTPHGFAGIAGLIPPHFPDASADDWRAFYTTLPALGGWVGAYAAWTPDGGTPAIARTQVDVGTQFGFRVLPVVGFHQDTHPGVRLTVQFADPADVARFAAGLAALASDTQPPYLGIGNEVNRVWEDDPVAFDAFVDALPDVVAAIHEASPDTRVFVTLQYEFLRGAGALSGTPRRPQWALLDRLTPHLDLIAFTTYPFFDYATPDAIPDDYYREAAGRAGIPIAFSEVGWPSAPLAAAPGSALGGTPEEQAAFIERLATLLEPAGAAFAMWAWAYDTPAVGSPFESLGLHDGEGMAKPALAAWQRLLAGR